MDAMKANEDFRLSRIEAAGWNAAHKLANHAELDEAAIMALNPHRMDPARARWYTGFRHALSSLETK
jgi:hypothetical protein